MAGNKPTSVDVLPPRWGFTVARRTAPCAVGYALSPRMGLFKPPLKHRGGFSLLELLVVIGIIAFLISISAVMYANFVDRAREAATAGLIKKIHEQLNQRIQAFGRALDNEDLDGAVEQKKKVLQQQQVFNVSEKALEILVKKDRFKRSFPQSFNELPDADGNSVPDLVDRFVQQTGATYNAAEHEQRTESAFLLYYIVTHADVFGISPVDTDEFSTKEIRDTDNNDSTNSTQGDGLPEFVDSWGRPLRFYRWPTRLVRPGEDTNGNGSLDPGEDENNDGNLDGPGVGLNRDVTDLLIKGLPAQPSGGQRDPLDEDPDDPLGILVTERDRLSPQFGNQINEDTYHTLDTYHVPLIVSPGPDETLGLYEPYELDSGNNIYGTLAQPRPNAMTLDGPLSDNVTNRNQRAGGS